MCGDRPSRRTPFDQAVSELDEVADELRLTEAKEERQKRLTQDQGAVAAVEGKAIPGEARVAKECQICMAAPREVRSPLIALDCTRPNLYGRAARGALRLRPLSASECI